MTRKIKVFEGENVVYEGPEHRYLAPSGLPSPKLGVSDLIKMGFYLIVAVAFFVKMDSRLSVLEGNQFRFVQAIDLFTAYVKNADNYHSAATGREFVNGRPVDTFGEIGSYHPPTSPLNHSAQVK